MINGLVDNQTQLENKKAEVASLQKRNNELLAKLAFRKQLIENSLKEKNKLLAKAETELKTLQSSQTSSPKRAATSSKVSKSLAYRPSRGAPRSGVVNIALSLVGKPYRYGAAGPNSFDCSGFTMYVYAKVGVSLPHSSRAQYNSGAQVPRSDLQPGDLVFFARGRRISHVGMYVGGGNFIHAPQTGETVRVQSLSSHRGYVGAVRP